MKKPSKNTNKKNKQAQDDFLSPQKELFNGQGLSNFGPNIDNLTHIPTSWKKYMKRVMDVKSKGFKHFQEMNICECAHVGDIIIFRISAMSKSTHKNVAKAQVLHLGTSMERPA